MNAFERYTLILFARKTLENAMDARNMPSVMSMSRLMDDLCLQGKEFDSPQPSSTSA